MNDRKIMYLQMIQSTINRMSTTSAIFKGFCATIVAGITAVSFSEINKWVLLLALSPVLCFLLLDIYYLQLERRYRALYNRVRVNIAEVDFDMTPPNTSYLHASEKCTTWDCVKSPSIFLFYLPIVFILVAIIIMKFMEVV